MPLTPNNREEHWLQGMVDGQTDLTPNNREEHWYKGMVDGETTLTPNKRSEYWYKEIVDKIGSGGGGGGGDYTTATLTITVEGDGDLAGVRAPVLVEIDGGIKIAGTQAQDDETVEYTVVLYKGSAFVSLWDKTGTATTTGDITGFGESYIMSGNASVVISA